MNCPKCDAIVAAENVNIQALVAKCEKCNEVFRVNDHLPAERESLVDELPPRVPRPATLIVHDEGDVRVIRRRWFRPAYFFLLFFCIAWDSFLIFWYSMGVGAGGGMPWIFFVFPIAHVAVGVVLTYFVVAGFLNKSYLGVTTEGVYVRHRPVPWFGNRNLATDDIREVYVELGMTRTGGNAEQQYTLTAVVADGQRVKLLGGLDASEAHFCAQQLNEWLGLKPSRLGVRM